MATRSRHRRPRRERHDPTAGVALQFLAMDDDEREAYQLGLRVGRLTAGQRAFIFLDLENLLKVGRLV